MIDARGKDGLKIMRRLFLVLFVAVLLVACMVPSVAYATDIDHIAYNQVQYSDGYVKASFISTAHKYKSGWYYDIFSGRSVGHSTVSTIPNAITIADTWIWHTTNLTIVAGVSGYTPSMSVSVSQTANAFYWTGTTTAPCYICSHTFDGIVGESPNKITSEEEWCSVTAFWAPGTWIQSTAHA
jgi:hypothetical protein